MRATYSRHFLVAAKPSGGVVVLTGAKQGTRCRAAVQALAWAALEFVEPHTAEPSGSSSSPIRRSRDSRCPPSSPCCRSRRSTEAHHAPVNGVVHMSVAREGVALVDPAARFDEKDLLRRAVATANVATHRPVVALREVDHGELRLLRHAPSPPQERLYEHSVGQPAAPWPYTVGPDGPRHPGTPPGPWGVASSSPSRPRPVWSDRPGKLQTRPPSPLQSASGSRRTASTGWAGSPRTDPGAPRPLVGLGGDEPRWRSIRQILDTEGTCPWRCSGGSPRCSDASVHYQVNSRTPGGTDEGAPTRGTKPTSLRERMRKEHGSTPSDPSAPSVRGRIDARWF